MTREEEMHAFKVKLYWWTITAEIEWQNHMNCFYDWGLFKETGIMIYRCQ